MKKTYVKPIANNVAFAMNENIAASFSSAHLGYVNEANINDGSCNEYLADTGISSGIIGEVETMADLMDALFRMYDQIGNDKFEELMADIRTPGQFGCWKY